VIEKPIIFTPDMVRAILNTKPGVWPPEPIDPGKPFKSQARRVIKPQPQNVISPDRIFYHNGYISWDEYDGTSPAIQKWQKCPYPPETVLWVRETWCECWQYGGSDLSYGYRADGQTRYQETMQIGPSSAPKNVKWCPSIHMPRAAARLFLLVKRVRVERLQEITEEDARAEGVDHCCPSYRHRNWSDKWISGYCHDCAHHNPMTGKRETCGWSHDDDEVRFHWWCGCSSGGFELRDDNIPEPYRFKFAYVWDEMLKPPFWSQNPWVWVIEFERQVAAE